MNVAVTLPELVTWQLVPLQTPPKPAKVKPVPADAESVTDVPAAKLAVQVVGQSIPAGLLVTVPVPVTATVT